jgi:Mn-dependent DtxR family transcriptional regulator
VEATKVGPTQEEAELLEHFLSEETIARLRQFYARCSDKDSRNSGPETLNHEPEAEG